jgi:hypothetical protein
VKKSAAFVGVAGVLVLLSALSVMLLHDPKGDRLLPALSLVVASPQAVPSPVDPTPATVSPTLAPALPVPSP